MSYLAILKNKQAEYGALGVASPDVRDALYPLIEVIPPESEDDGVKIAATLAATAEKLSKAWSGHVAVDAGHLNSVVPTPSGKSLVEILAEQSSVSGLRYVPVARLSDGPNTRSQMRAIAAADRRGVLIRVTTDDLDGDAATLDARLVRLANDLNLSLNQLDVLIDLGATNGSSAVNALLVRVVSELINGMPNILAWRSLYVASGAFPLNLDSVSAYGTALLPRSDWIIWQAVSASVTTRLPSYGDYAIQHPALPTSRGFGPAPQIRYTVDGAWRVRKGKKGDRRGHAQFYDICAAVVASPEYVGKTFSWGDDYIDLAARSAPTGATLLTTTGNASTWRQIGTSHHLAFVVNRLATLSVP